LNTTAIVLAAGRSERMGTAKARLFLGDRRALDRVLDASQGAARTILVLNPTLPAPSGRNSGRFSVVINEHPEQGPLSSLQLALASESCPADHYLLFPVDYPLVERQVVEALVAAAAERRARVLIPTYRGRNGHPVVFAGALSSELVALAPGRTARDVLLRPGAAIEKLEVPHESVRIDMDTPFDYGRADALARRREIEERLRGARGLRIALGRTGGVLSHERHPGPSGFALSRAGLEGALSEEWQASDEREFAAALFLPTLATAFLIAAAARPLSALEVALGRAGCRELIAPSMAAHPLADEGSPAWRESPEVNGWRRDLTRTNRPR
jgi:molybdenum cofactor cytidylyltransferase